VALQDTIFSVTGVIPPVDINSITGIQDNCISPPTVTFIQQTSSGSCPVIINRLYIVIDACGNSTDVIQTIVNSSTVNPIQANFSFYPQTISPINSTIQFINSSTGGNNYTWDFGDNEFSNQYEPVHAYDEQTECTGMTVTLVVSDGICVDTVTQVIPCEEETIFYVPNTFTPDGDQFNNTFYPVFYSGFDPFNFEMLIFNRWGELIFETHDVKYGWDGTLGTRGRKVQDGVYTWKITYKKKENDRRVVVVGHVTLIR
jgi:gliding motility-associated-like protein